MAKKEKKMARVVAKACPECGQAMTYETREDRVEYKGHKKSFPNTAWWCPCGESIQDGGALQAAERAFIELRAEVDAVLLPEQVAEVRGKLHLSQRKAGELLGGGPRAFQKYESGETPVSIPMKNLLLLLGNDPKRLGELAREDGEVVVVRGTPRVVKVKMRAAEKKRAGGKQAGLPRVVKVKVRAAKKKRTGRTEQASHA